MAKPRALQPDLPDPKGLVLEGQQVDALHHQVAAQLPGRNAFAPRKAGNNGQVLGLQQRDGPLATTACVVIAHQPSGANDRRGGFAERCVAGWPHANPDEATGAHESGVERMHWHFG